jgi:hypothetical protein
MYLVQNVSCTDEIFHVALFGVHVSLEVQFQMQTFSPIVVNLLHSWQVQPSCCHHQLKFSDDLLLVCLKHSRSPEISNKFDQHNGVQVVVSSVDDNDILDRLVVGSGQRHAKGQFPPFPQQCTSPLYHRLCLYCLHPVVLIMLQRNLKVTRSVRSILHERPSMIILIILYLYIIRTRYWELRCSGVLRSVEW